MPSNILTTDNKDFADSTAGNNTTSYLVPRRLLPQVYDAVRKNLVLRGLAAQTFGPSAIPGSTLVIPNQVEFTSDNKLPIQQVSQGGEIPAGATKFGDLTFTPVKYGVRIGVAKEMQEDGIIDLLDYHADLAGYEFADNEEQLIVSALNTASSNASNDVSNSNETIALTDITEAMQNLEAKGYEGTDMIVGVEVANDLRNLEALNSTDFGQERGTKRKLVGTIFEMNVIVSRNVSAKLAYVIDRKQAFAIAEKRPLTIQRYNDYARDTGYIACTQRIAVSAWRNSAVAEITTA